MKPIKLPECPDFKPRDGWYANGVPMDGTEFVLKGRAECGRCRRNGRIVEPLNERLRFIGRGVYSEMFADDTSDRISGVYHKSSFFIPL